MSLLVFPLAALLNSFSMTALLLVFGITGLSETAADIGLVQAATLALFYAFSANARNLILADPSGLAAIRLLQARLLLFVPLAVAAYLLSVEIGSVAAPLALALILRRASEWMGEIGLARHERLRQPAFAMHTLTLECVTFLLCLLLPILFGLSLAVSAIPWALAPLLAVRSAKLALRSGRGHFPFLSLLPHFGSTAIIGSSVYVFRISIALLAGKAIAGDLFTAFAVGGLIPTIYGQALAPTLAHRFGDSGLPKWLLAIPAAMLMISTGLSVIALSEPAWLVALGRPSIFWLAVALSIGGGAMMSVAAALRTRLIQQAAGQDVFGPDLLANVLIATCVPFAFYVLGPTSLAGLYVLSGCLSLAFLWGVGTGRGISDRQLAPALLGICVLLLMPLFFQIEGGLFEEAVFVFDTEGDINRLPIPVSILALFGGIALLGNYACAARTLAVLFFTALLFITSALVAAQSSPLHEGAKLILLAQFLLPMFGLVLGQMYGSATNAPVFERAALWILVLIIPSQLISTWLQGYSLLAPKVFFFSIYQHLQYFPMMVVAMTFLVVSAFWSEALWRRRVLVVMVPITAVYIVASQSLLAVVAFAVGLVLLLAVQSAGRHSRRLAMSVLLTALLASLAYGALSQSGWLGKVLNLDRPAPVQQTLGDKLTPASVQPAPAELSALKAGSDGVASRSGFAERMGYWRFYASGIMETPSGFLFGQASPPDRQRHPSAHNYWLDALYNFGALSVLPVLILLLRTMGSLWKWRSEIIASPLLLGVSMATIYLLLGENMLKVGMRQPYPGIITFFIWGVLIARLRTSTKEEGSVLTQL